MSSVVAPDFLTWVADRELRQRLAGFNSLVDQLEESEKCGVHAVPVITLSALRRFIRMADDQEKELRKDLTLKCRPEYSLHIIHHVAGNFADRCQCRAYTSLDMKRDEADHADRKVRLGELCSIDGHPLRATGFCYCGERTE